MRSSFGGRPRRDRRRARRGREGRLARPRLCPRQERFPLPRARREARGGLSRGARRPRLRRAARPAGHASLDRFIAAVWGVGLYFGYALSQNPDGDLIGHVVDATGEDATPRMYRSNFELHPHNDITAMISLACWHKSQSGGATAIVSAATVHDEIRRRAPHLLEVLYRGFHYHRLGEEGPDEAPVSPYRIPVFAVRDGQVSLPLPARQHRRRPSCARRAHHRDRARRHQHVRRGGGGAGKSAGLLPRARRHGGRSTIMASCTRARASSTIPSPNGGAI